MATRINWPGNTAEWPTFTVLRSALLSAGFRFGDSLQDYEAELSDVPHALETDQLDAQAVNHHPVYRCARVLLDICRNQHFELGGGVGEAARYGPAFVGPKQLELLEELDRQGVQIQLLAGYRSLAYQALLFAARYLSGTLLDASGRYTAAPPGYSDHHIIDGALDVGDAAQFMCGLLRLDSPEIQLSLVQPYLSDPVVSYEPWHWRTICTPLVMAVEVMPADQYQRWRHELALILQSLDEPEAKGSPVQDYVFAAGVAQNGAVKCIGSKQQSRSASIRDALAAVGPGWAASYVSIPIGYTPIFDNQVQPYDVGRATFQIHPRRGGEATFLTGASCLWNRTVTPPQIADELVAKAQLDGRTPYRIEKSLTTDMIVLPNHVVPASYGLPLNPFERESHVPSLLIEDYSNWLARGRRCGLPIYWSKDYCRTCRTGGDPARYAMLLAWLLRYRPHLPRHVLCVIEDLAEIYFRGEVGRIYIESGIPPSDEIPEATIVYLATGLLHGGHQTTLETLWKSQATRLKAYVRAIFAAPSDPNGWLFLGHICNLAREACSIGNTSLKDSVFTDFGLTSDRLMVVLERSQASVLHAGASAQILGYAFQQFGQNARFVDMAEGLLCKLLAAGTSMIRDEDGAFLGLESFQTALPIEGMLHLRRILPLCRSDDRLVLSRVSRAILFLRRLQFQPGSGVLTSNPHLLEGAVRFSLVDHHFRMDYGMHALGAAVEFLQAMELSGDPL